MMDLVRLMVDHPRHVQLLVSVFSSNFSLIGLIVPQILRFLISRRFILKLSLHAHFWEVFSIFSQMTPYIVLNPKAPPCTETFRLSHIKRGNRFCGLTWAQDREKKSRQERNFA